MMSVENVLLFIKFTHFLFFVVKNSKSNP